MSAKTTKKIVKKSIQTNVDTVESKLVSKGFDIEEDSNTERTSELPVDQVIDSANVKQMSKNTKGKSKKAKKCEYDNQNISVKSSFSKFDAMQKRNLIHVRSSDSSKAHKIFCTAIINSPDEQHTNCRHCCKPVYKMEEVFVQFKAEKCVYHKSCLRCKVCSKQLKFDNYQSHEGSLYCVIHFKLLFAPKIVDQLDEQPRKAELIIRESQPTELPPDVVRASDKPDLGLDELHQLNVRSRFQVFENGALEDEHQRRLASKRNLLVSSKYMSSEMDDSENVADVQDEDDDLVRSRRSTEKERPVGLGDAMNDIKSRFEKGNQLSKEERREERKQEIQNIRSRLFMGKQAKIKEMYQQAVAESEQAMTSVGKKPEMEIGCIASSIKKRFENGEIFNKELLTGVSDDAHVFESAISKESRNIFKELDANLTSNTIAVLKKNSSNSSFGTGKSNADIDVIKCDTMLEDIKVPTDELSQKFKFFETYKPSSCKKRQFRITPPREGTMLESDTDQISDDTEHQQRFTSFHDNVLQKTQTTSTMLNRFREMERMSKFHEEQGPKPLKCFTPPPDDGHRYNDISNSDEDDDDDDDDDEDEQTLTKDACVVNGEALDEALKEAQLAARAKLLRVKFEKWQANEIKRELNEGFVDIYSQQVSDDSTIESAKTIRERFENMKSCDGPSGPRYQVNRFVVIISMKYEQLIFITF
ncbi:CG33521 [Drosophila busckii]|uniref:CG33521 n=1 Tax=Drosophila busckii TaxID=30019 RepID=A0A0M4F7E1_DROBS|nr:CG33521 [Drosophila busckii]